MTTKLIKILFAVAVLLLVMLAAISFNHINKVTDSGNWVIHTHKIQIELNQLLSFIKDAESEQRGFLITKDSIFLDPIAKDRYNLNTTFANLKTLIKHNSAQSKNLDSLQHLISLRLALLTSTINSSTADNEHSTLIISNIKKGKALMQKIDSSISTLKLNENEFLTARKKKYASNLVLTPIISAFFFLFALFIFIFSFIKINKDLHLKKISNEALVINAAIMQQAEEIGQFFTWKWNMDDDKIIFSENMSRMLGYEPNEIEHTVQYFVNLTHPEDSEIVNNSIKSLIETRISTSVNFRMIGKGGQVLRMKSNSALLTDINGKQNLVGLTTDVTKDYLHNQSIIEKNYELKANNEELNSFNHIASHDLQEPLRKIQIFLSRIPEADFINMSAEGKSFIEKIKLSVLRMRNLINDLLLYSQASKEEAVFEQTNVNTIMDKAVAELSFTIEEKLAIINYQNLPTIKVIPFQIQQLFVNLISNSLKYAKSNVAPIISIKSVIVKGASVVGLVDDRMYYKFEYKDNGIGFEPQFSSTIFTLFKRLHSATTYNGSGIGLAICKKIVDNHKGIISATGTLNEGATFIFYLPK